MALFGHTFDAGGKARIAAYEADLQANASTDDWLADAAEPAQAADRRFKARRAYVNRICAQLGCTQDSCSNWIFPNDAAQDVFEELMDSYDVQAKADAAKAARVPAFANLHLHSDVEPFEVVRVVSPKCIEVRRMAATLSPDWKPVFHVGGFAANCSNQQSQVWLYASDPAAQVVKARLRKDGDYHSPYGRHRVAEAPRKFHDYNF